MEDIIKKYQKHITSLLGIGCNYFDIRLRQFSEPENIFCGRCPNKCDYKNTHLYGCYEAVRWDNKYIYYCPSGFIFIAVPIYEEDNVLGAGIVSGPILMGAIEDFQETYGLPFFETGKVNDLAEIISAIFVPKIKAVVREEYNSEFLNSIYKELEVVQSNKNYPIELEKELQTSISEHDGSKSKELLNKLLGQIFFHSDGDLKIIKARVLELIVMLSRAAIDGGASIEQIFALNNNYIEEVERFETLEKLSIWLTGIINRFVSYVFEFGDIKHTDMIYKITAYIKDNYMKKITLREISDYVYLSKSYVSKIFKEEMGISLSEYINKIRIDKSKALLLDRSLSIADVANLVGFEDQSYYTKIFRQVVGLSPGKYKEKHGKI